MKRTEPDQIRAVSLQLHAALLGEDLHSDLPLQPLDLRFRYAGHRVVSWKKAVKQNAALVDRQST